MMAMPPYSHRSQEAHKSTITPEQLFELKSIWKGKPENSWSFFCPLCRATRKISYSPRPTARHYGQIALSAIVFTLATWNWFEWKGIVSFIPLWTLFEVVYRSRVRVALNCPHCGFDPYLYLVDIKRAREEIETHWRKKFAEKGIPFPEKDRPAALNEQQTSAPKPAGRRVVEAEDSGPEATQ